MKKAVIVLPTYNEKENIMPILKAILKQQKKVTGYQLHVLVVDDSSPDGTGEIVKKHSKTHQTIHLLTGQKQGLGAAYIRGFRYALKELHADVLIEMDADFSHNPNDLPKLLKEIDDGYDFVIGSRYIPGGSIPANWSLLRKSNSKWGNIFARRVAGLTAINDCTGGFRAINKSLIKSIDLNNLQVKGYAFQISLLYQAIKNNANIKETPIKFIDRVKGESKIRLSDISEFIAAAFVLRYPFLSLQQLRKRTQKKIVSFQRKKLFLTSEFRRTERSPLA